MFSRLYHLPTAICTFLAVGMLTTLSSCESAGPPQQAAANQAAASQPAAPPATEQPTAAPAAKRDSEPALLSAAELADGWISW